MKYYRGVLLVLALVVLSGCSLKSTPESASTTSNDFTSQQGKTVTAKTAENLAKAKVQAGAWKPDAVFTGYNFKVPANLNPKSLTETFVFGSVADPDNWWTYSIDTDGKNIRAVVPKGDFLGKDLQPIQESYWKKSYVDALIMADDNGGSVYKAKYPEAETIITLAQIQPKNWLWYIVEYRSATNNKKIRVNAYDGKIYDDNGNLVSSQSK